MRATQVCFAMLVALVATAAVSSAQSAGVVGKKYESYVTGDCAGVSFTFCYATFPTNPSTSVIEITLVSCAIVSNGLPIRVSLKIVDAQGTVFKTRFVGVANSVSYSGANNFYSTVNDPTSMLLGVNRKPQILVEAQGVIANVYCTLSGTVQ